MQHIFRNFSRSIQRFRPLCTVFPLFIDFQRVDDTLDVKGFFLFYVLPFFIFRSQKEEKVRWISHNIDGCSIFADSSSFQIQGLLLLSDSFFKSNFSRVSKENLFWKLQKCQLAIRTKFGRTLIRFSVFCSMKPFSRCLSKMPRA